MATALSDSERGAAERLALLHNDRVAEAELLMREVAGIFQMTVEDMRNGTEIRHVDARTVVAVSLDARGWKPEQIGDAVNKNRRTVYNLIERARTIPQLQDMLRSLGQANGS